MIDSMADIQKIAVFLLPNGASKRLTEAGWEFDSEKLLPMCFVNPLMRRLALQSDNSFLGIDVYRNENIQANVEKSDSGLIEIIYFQCPRECLTELRLALSTIPDTEVFIPSIDPIRNIST